MHERRGKFLPVAQLLSRLGGCGRGGIAIQFSLLIIPLMLLMGGAVEYSNTMRVRDALQSAADAASVGVIATGTATYLAGMQMSGDGTITSASADALALFRANMANLSGYSSYNATASITKSGLTLTSRIVFSASTPSVFLSLAGQNAWSVGSVSVATAQLPKYLDFYLMVDVSGSMGLPSTSSEQSRLALVNPDNRSDYPSGCVFACHFSWASGYTLSRNGGVSTNPQVASCPSAGTSACIQLRTDAVGVAIQKLLQTAQSTEIVSNQYRIGLYPFIAQLYSYFPITASISTPATDTSSLAYAAGNITSLLDTGADANLGSGGTHFETAVTKMNQIITSVGTGLTSTNTLPFVFLITDGAQNNQYQSGGNWWGSNSPTTLNPAYCNSLKNRGIVVAVLYIPYQPIVNPTTFANSEDFYANANIPFIPGALKSCASTNYFFTANTPADITSAMNAMFNQAVASTRITN